MKNKKTQFAKHIQIKNRKAGYEYELLDKYQAGIMLTGTEIKSIREGKASIQEAYCYLTSGEAFVKSMHIAPYSHASFHPHEQNRDRKLLLHKKELKKLLTKTQEKGLTIVPTRLFINDRGYAKLEIALAKGKKIHDKRNSIKKKEQDRELNKMKWT